MGDCVSFMYVRGIKRYQSGNVHRLAPKWSGSERHEGNGGLKQPIQAACGRSQTVLRCGCRIGAGNDPGGCCGWGHAVFNFLKNEPTPGRGQLRCRVPRALQPRDSWNLKAPPSWASPWKRQVQEEELCFHSTVNDVTQLTGSAPLQQHH